MIKRGFFMYPGNQIINSLMNLGHTDIHVKIHDGQSGTDK